MGFYYPMGYCIWISITPWATAYGIILSHRLLYMGFYYPIGYRISDSIMLGSTAYEILFPTLYSTWDYTIYHSICTL
jgi:hypothetical protein